MGRLIFVFPTPVGMNRSICLFDRLISCVPHARGDEPIGSGRKIILVEGYATGLSVHAAVKQMSPDACVMCCFSAGNIVHIANTHGHFVMADCDSSKTGEKSAIETGLPWDMPSIEGMDWNDVHANDGLMRVCVALKDLFRKVA